MPHRRRFLVHYDGSPTHRARRRRRERRVAGSVLFAGSVVFAAVLLTLVVRMC